MTNLLNTRNEEFKKIMIDITEKKRLIEFWKEEIGMYKFQAEKNEEAMKDIKNKVNHNNKRKSSNEEEDLYTEKYKNLPGPILESLKALAFSNHRTSLSLDTEISKSKNYNEELKSKMKGIKSEMSKSYTCLHCREEFNLEKNTDSSCTYHIGRIKYFSCIGCGQDQYYSCCRNCKNCKKGCKIGKHVNSSKIYLLISNKFSHLSENK